MSGPCWKCHSRCDAEKAQASRQTSGIYSDHGDGEQTDENGMAFAAAAERGGGQVAVGQQRVRSDLPASYSNHSGR